MNDECLVCGAPLEYIQSSEDMECCICHRVLRSNSRCTNGHYVCDQCHTQGLDSVVRICKEETSKNPFVVIDRLMLLPTTHMHGPEHHILVAASLLTAFRNAGGEVDFDRCLSEIISRGRTVPGGICGMWGTCGAAVSTGIFISVITGSSPLAKESWSQSNTITSRALSKIGEHGGPRCCKRDSYLALAEAVQFINEKFGVDMESNRIECHFYPQNNQCLGRTCPFHPTIE